MESLLAFRRVLRVSIAHNSAALSVHWEALKCRLSTLLIASNGKIGGRQSLQGSVDTDTAQSLTQCFRHSRRINRRWCLRAIQSSLSLISGTAWKKQKGILNRHQNLHLTLKSPIVLPPTCLPHVTAFLFYSSDRLLVLYIWNYYACLSATLWIAVRPRIK